MANFEGGWGFNDVQAVLTLVAAKVILHLLALAFVHVINRLIKPNSGFCP